MPDTSVHSLTDPSILECSMMDWYVTRYIYPANCKVCVFDLVQLEDDIGYIKSSHTDLSSSN